ncbi:MAG: T9SS type A sorting domain-containing protein, partial [Bacteroidia bacterium]
IYSFNYLSYAGSALVSPDPSSGTNTLDINMVNAELIDCGDLHWGFPYNSYEVPKGSGRNAIFASALWVGGIDNGGALHQAAMTYRQTGNDFWPGPLDTISGTTDSLTSANYNKIWKVDRLKIEEFKYMYAIGAVTSGAYTVDNDIITWPATGTGNMSRKLAPFVDVNHDGIYNPLVDGDYPDIKGDQMCYWIFNDNLMSHTETGGTPLKVEVHASAYAYVCSTITDSLKALNYTTFYNYQIFNRSTENYHNTFLGIWQDTDLGSASDDFVGCTPSLNYGSFFNGDDVDDNPPSGQITYGIKPPMLSDVILNGPRAEPGDGIDNNNNGIVDEPGEKNLMTHFLYYNNDGTVTGNPNGAKDCYNYMNGIWRDSTHLTYGGNGHLGSTPHNFMFDGIPGDVSGWSEETAGDVPADRRYIMGCGPFNLNAGTNVPFDYAIVYTRDTASAYTIQNLYQKNKEDVMRIQQWYSLDSFPSCLTLNVGIKNLPSIDNSISIYPNPASENLIINYTSTSKNSSAKIYDTTGRLVKSINNLKSGETDISISELKNGLYLINIIDGKTSVTKRFVKE